MEDDRKGESISLSLVGREAPSFTARAVVKGEIEDDFSLKRFENQYLLFLFYPADFTFVCPTELHAFQERFLEFKSRDTQIVACSTDSVFSHLAWLNTPKKDGGIEGIGYPLVADVHKTIAQKYRVFDEREGTSVRGTFLIDRRGIIRHQSVNDALLGRSTDEILRLVDALIFSEMYRDVCPANWVVGEKALHPSREGIRAYFKN